MPVTWHLWVIRYLSSLRNGAVFPVLLVSCNAWLLAKLGWMTPKRKQVGVPPCWAVLQLLSDILLPLTDLTVTFFPEYHMSIGFQLAREVPKLIVSNDPSILRYKSVITFHSRPSLYHSFSLCLNKRIHPKEKRAVVAQHFARQMLPHMNVISYNYLLYISVLRFGMLSPTHHIP